MPRVTLVLPVHNGAKYLESAIDSVLNQSYTDFELICVDDASTDESLKILTAAAARDGRVRLICLKENVGLPAALNRGFKDARGCYFSWTSDDNLLRTHMLETLVDALDANPHCAIVHSNYSVINPDGEVIDFVNTRSRAGLLMGNHIGASFLYKREVDHVLNGYNIELFGAEDFDFWLRASTQFQFLHLNEDLYLYRKHPHSLTNSRAEKIQALITQIILCAIPTTMSRDDRAEVLFALFRRNFVRLRMDILWRGFLSSPVRAMVQAPSLFLHILRVIRTRLRG